MKCKHKWLDVKEGDCITIEWCKNCGTLREWVGKNKFNYRHPHSCNTPPNKVDSVCAYCYGQGEIAGEKLYICPKCNGSRKQD